MARLGPSRVYGNIYVDGSATIGIALQSGDITTSGVFTSTVATGLAPLVVASTTKVTNLNCDLFDDLSSVSLLRSDASNAYDIRLTDGDGRGLRF
jgi:hypothetical protein